MYISSNSQVNLGVKLTVAICGGNVAFARYYLKRQLTSKFFW